MASMILRKGLTSYRPSTYAQIHMYMWDSRYIGQVIEGIEGESLEFNLPEIITPIAPSATNGTCSERVENCLSKETETLTLNNFVGATYKVDRCDIEKATAFDTNISYDAYMLEIEFQYLKMEDAAWLKVIDDNLATTSLTLGGTTAMGGAISSFQTLISQMKLEVKNDFEHTLQDSDLAIGVSEAVYAELESLYQECCYLGSAGMLETIGANEFGVKSFYRIPEDLRKGIAAQEADGTPVTVGGFTEDTHIIVYPYDCAQKAFGCKYNKWDDGAGKYANMAYYNKDSDYVVDFKKVRPSDTNYTGVKYVKLT